jgi:hypothetical protein
MHATLKREKRSHPRVAVAIAIVCERDGAPPITGTARDIGIGGVFIESLELPPFGSSVTVVMLVPGVSAQLRLPGVVRWTKASGFGVQFGLLGARETHAISTLLR